MKAFLAGLISLLASSPAFGQSLGQAPVAMLVPAGSSLYGVAGTASAISYKIDFIEQQSTQFKPNPLDVGQLANSVGSIYTPATGYVGLGTSITLTNTTGSAVLNVALYIGGTGASNEILSIGSFVAHGTCDWTAASGWKCFDANKNLLTASSGGTTYSAGTGISLSSNTFSLTVPVAISLGGTGQTSLSAVSLSSFGVPTGSVSWGSQKINSLQDPASPQDAATKAYVDSVAQGLSVKDSVDYATTTTLPTYTYNNGASGVGATITEVGSGALPAIDGISPVASDDFLVKNETALNAPYNGIYVVTQLGTVGTPFILTRRNDADSPGDLADSFCFVELGTVNSNAGFVLPLNAGSIVVGTTSLNFIQFSGAGQITAGAGMTKTGNTLNVGQNPDNSVVVNSDDIQRAAITGDVAISLGSNVSILGNIPTGTTAAGSILHSNIAAPSTPASGKDSVYTDSTDLRFHDKNASGSIGTTVVSDTGATNNFLTAISTAGVISKAQPAFSNLSGSATCTQLPALTGAITTSAGSCATTAAAIPTTALTGTLQAAQEPAHTGGVTNTAGNLALTVITNANLTGPVTSTGNATAVTNNAITNAMLAQAPTLTIKGNNTGGTANETDLTASQVKTLLAIVCADVTNAGTACTQNTGTSGATIPFLNGTNTWAGVNTFSSAPVMSGASITAATIPSTALVSTITAGGPTGSATVAPIVTWNAAGQLTAVTSATITPAVSSITGLGTGCATWLATPSSANLRACLTDELGTGSALFDGATPTSFVLTNATGLPTTGLTGTLQAAQFPALSGDTTTTAGSLTTTTGKVNGVTYPASPSTNTIPLVTGTNTVTYSSASAIKTVLAIVSTDISDFASAVRATVLTGLSVATNSVITAADSVLSALGKLQAQITANKTVYNAVGDFGMVGDQRVVFDGACSTGANTHVTSATVAFVSADVGKRITLAGGGASGAMLAATVSVINSGTDVTISGSTCGTTVSAKGLQVGTDNTTACNLMVSTVNGLTYPGAKIIFPPSSTNRYPCPVPLPFTKGAILEGQGAGINQDAGDYSKQGGTALVWWGTDNDGGVAFQGFINFAAIVANNQPMPGVGIHDLWIDCRNGDQNPCASAFRMVDVVGFDIRDFFVMDPLSAIDMATADMGSVTASTSRGIMSNIGARVLDNTLTAQAGVATAVNLTPTTIAAGSTGQVMTAALTQNVIVAAANGFATPGYFWFTGTNGSVYLMKCGTGGGTTTLGSCGVSTDGASESPTLVTGANIVQASPNNGACMLFEGTASTNSNSMEVDMSRFSYGTNYGPACLEFHNSDSNTFRQPVMNGGNPANDGAINRVRRTGARFGASATGSIQASRNNTFYDGDPGSLNGGGVVAMGLSNAGAILTGASGPNYWYRYQVGNGVTLPIAEAVTATATQAPVGPILEWTANGAYTQELGPNRPSVLVPSNALASTAATDVVIPGCLIKNPPQWAQAGAQIQFRIGMTKTAAGIPTQLFKIFYGASGAVGTDTAALATTAGAVATAAIDAQEITLNLLLPSTGASVTPTGMALRTGKNAAVGAGYGAMSATAPTMAAINTGTLQTFFYPAIRTSATGETNTIVSCEAKIVQAAAY